VATHQIRLCGPWDYTLSPSVKEITVPSRGTTAMPFDWENLCGNVSSTATFVRRFHCPTNLDPHEEVWIVLSGVRGTGSVSLNGHHLHDFDSNGLAVECPVTSHLIPFNLLEIQITVDPETHDQPRGLFLPVILEIRS